MLIREANVQDFEQIEKIYNYYIENSVITFEEEFVTAQDMIERFKKIKNSKLPWIVAYKEAEILGYAYAHFWHERSAYRFTVEPSIYLNPKYIGNGIGKALFKELLSQLKSLGIKNALSLITVPNEASIALHEKLGFEKVGLLPDVGFKFDKWLSVGFWQLKL